tara:strand:+ start:622 stop:1005 length:384 start_codon:yes stop_codon:yes gene_type:complete
MSRINKSPSLRLGRLANQIKRDLSRIISSEVKDPRVGIITITDVLLSNDYKHAKIYFTTLVDDELSIKNTLLGLTKSASFLRLKLSKCIVIHSLPYLRFIYDKSAIDAITLSKLIDNVNFSKINSTP